MQIANWKNNCLNELFNSIWNIKIDSYIKETFEKKIFSNDIKVNNIDNHKKYLSSLLLDKDETKNSNIWNKIIDDFTFMWYLINNKRYEINSINKDDIEIVNKIYWTKIENADWFKNFINKKFNEFENTWTYKVYNLLREKHIAFDNWDIKILNNKIEKIMNSWDWVIISKTWNIKWRNKIANYLSNNIKIYENWGKDLRLETELLSKEIEPIVKELNLKETKIKKIRKELNKNNSKEKNSLISKIKDETFKKLENDYSIIKEIWIKDFDDLEKNIDEIRTKTFKKNIINSKKTLKLWKNIDNNELLKLWKEISEIKYNDWIKSVETSIKTNSIVRR